MTIKDIKGCGHLKTRLSTVKTSKRCRFRGAHGNQAIIWINPNITPTPFIPLEFRLRVEIPLKLRKFPGGPACWHNEITLCNPCMKVAAGRGTANPPPEDARNIQKPGKYMGWVGWYFLDIQNYPVIPGEDRCLEPLKRYKNLLRRCLGVQTCSHKVFGCLGFCCSEWFWIPSKGWWWNIWGVFPFLGKLSRQRRWLTWQWKNNTLKMCDLHFLFKMVILHWSC